MKLQLPIGAACVVILCGAAYARQTPAGDEAAVRQTVADYVAAFNSKDAKKFLDFQTPDEDGRDPRDGTFLPKRSVEDQQQGFSANPLLHWTHTIDRVRMIAPDVALVDTTATDVRPLASGEQRTTRRLITYVMTKVGGAWKIAAVRQSLLS